MIIQNFFKSLTVSDSIHSINQLAMVVSDEKVSNFNFSITLEEDTNGIEKYSIKSLEQIFFDLTN